MKKYSSSGSEDRGCLNAGFAKILSRTSIKSTSSSAKSVGPVARAEYEKLHSEIGQLKQTIENFNQLLDDKDASIGSLAREKEKSYVELKKVQRINRNILQQLEDERDFYHKEKEHYCQELISAKRFLRRDGQQVYESLRIEELEREVGALQGRLDQKDKVIYNLCVKYLRIKSSKVTLRSKMENINSLHQQAYDYIAALLDASRGEIDKLLRDKIRSPATSVTSKKYLNLIRRNARLHYENTQLKIHLAALPTDQLQGEGDQKDSYTKKCEKSHYKLQLLNRGERCLARPIRSIYTLSHGEKDVQSCFTRRSNIPGFEMVMFDYPRISVRRPCSDPG